MTTHTYWASIGRNLPTGGRLTDGQWDDFTYDLRRRLERLNATVLGTVDGQGWWDGESEATHLALFTIPSSALEDLHTTLGTLAAEYGQDAIGLVGGPETETLVYSQA